MKYNAGDKVRIKSLDWYNENKDENGIVELSTHIFTPGMSQFCGKVMTIEDVFEDDIEENIEETTKENVEEKISEITKEVITESESDLNKTLIFVIVTVPVVCLAGAGGVFFTFKFKK